MQESIIATKSFAFALEIVSLYRRLCRCREYVLSKQLLRSGTSIGANVEEALGAQSRKDFLSKMYIALKEARETRYWLQLLKYSDLVDTELDRHLRQVDELIRLLCAITKTIRQGPSHQPADP